MTKFLLDVRTNQRPKTANAFSPALRRVLFYIPFSFIALLIAIKATSFDLYWDLMGAEDSLAEYATCLVYLLATALTIKIAWTHYQAEDRRAAWLLIIMAFGYFVIAMEEISWFQRILDINSPAFFEQNNLQAETNLHNLLANDDLHKLYMLVGFYGAYGWRFFSKKMRIRLPRWSKFTIPDKQLRWYFLPTFLLYFYFDYINRFLVHVAGLEFLRIPLGHQGWLIGKDQEPIEFLLGLGFLIHMLWVSRHHKPEHP